MPVAQTERLVLRQLTLDDAGALEAVFCDPEVMEYSDGLQSPDWVREWVAQLVGQWYPAWGFGDWAVTEKTRGTVLGYCGLSRYPGRCADDEAELGFRLARAHWGRGYATEAASAAVDHGLNAHQLRRIIAIVDPDNLASVRVLQKLGMRHQGEISFPGYTHPDHVYVTEGAADL